MNLSMYTQYARHLKEFESNVEAFKFFYGLGIRYADVLSSEFKALSLEEYSNRLNEAGISIGSVVSLHETPSFTPSLASAARAEVRSLIDRMEKLGISMMMVAPKVDLVLCTDDFKRLRENMVEAYADAVEYAKGAGIKIMIENQSMTTRPDMPAFEGVAIGDGVLPNKEILARMKEYGYKVNLNLEINSKIINLERLVKSAEFLRNHS